MDFPLEFPDRSPGGIAATIARGVSAGDLAPGDRLPTVRTLAAAIGVSPATISAAWQALGRAGLIESRGRAGSFVRERRRDWLTPRMRGLAGYGEPLKLDLSRGTPDPALLPPLGPALGRVSMRAETGSYQELPVMPELARVLAESWPTTAQSITVVDGALDGISRTLEELLSFGDRVAIESPGFPPFYDLLDALGADAVPMAVDECGVTPAALSSALGRRVRAVLLQPRAHNPTGASMTEERARELAQILETHRDAADVVVVEDDHSGLISLAPDVSIGRWLPYRVVHVRSFSKSHGPDLRIAALGGPSAVIDRIVARRMLGPGWTSRMLQRILYDLLTDAAATAQVELARATYAARQRALVMALAEEGIALALPDGINLWLPVVSERAAIVQLAAAEIRVASGSPFMVGGGPEGAPEFVRVTVGGLNGDVAPLARALASAAAHTAVPVFALGGR
ncbi:aminotransferase class I/II-fold pyridoxal phosphate-dependent enzyme [Microbacterium sp. DT81.1]|uniref:aminotransferase class I/II-fold pyridoxal phosphate-dependent enzyme n=1 Tax=Microbacterium sp. DT81.1 TaxID=3393413 RepID=UPI003CF5685A